MPSRLATLQVAVIEAKSMGTESEWANEDIEDEKKNFPIESNRARDDLFGKSTSWLNSDEHPEA